MQYAQFKDSYDRNGFVVIPAFLSSSELRELRREIDRFLREVVPSLPDHQVFFESRSDGGKEVRQIHRMSCDSYFDVYRRNEKWISLATTLVGEPVTARPPFFFNKPSKTEFPTPPHQDNCAFSLNPASGTEILLAINARFDQQSGCLRYLPGSHQRGMRPHKYSGVRGFSAEVADFGPEDEAREVAVLLEPGDVVCHHPMTVHRAMPNRSQRHSRTALSIWFQGESARVDPGILSAYEQMAQQALRIGH
jgi:phytanoyl-CoA hydroxylase